MGYQYPYSNHYWLCRWRRDWFDTNDVLWLSAISQSRNSRSNHCDCRCSDGFCQCKAKTDIGLMKMCKKSPVRLTGLFYAHKRAGYGSELLIVLKVLPIFGTSKRITAITTIATSARIIAYSTRP